MSKIQYNVGTFKGLLGTAILYLTKTSAGTEFISFLALEGNTEYWTYMSRTAIQSYMLTKDVILSSNIDVSKLADVAPDGVLDASGHVIVDNGDGLPRLATGQSYYSVKGAGISDFTSDKGTPTTGSDQSGSTVVIANKAKTMSEALSEAATWAGKNWWIVAIIVFVLLELFGVSHILDQLSGNKKPKKKGRKR